MSNILQMLMNQAMRANQNYPQGFLQSFMHANNQNQSINNPGFGNILTPCLNTISVDPNSILSQKSTENAIYQVKSKAFLFFYS